MTTYAPRRPRRTVQALVAAVGLTLLAVPYQAAPAHAAPDAPKILLVMDASGSMAGPADDGTTKIDAAKASLLTMLEHVPDGVQVGLRVFGGTAGLGGGQACTDSQLIAPLATGDHAAIETAIASYTPNGETPISFALQEAAKDLGDSGQRSIILVSDGVATCPPDPCEIAGELKQSGIDLRIDVVGLGVASDPTAKSQLECVAAAGGGEYYDASTQQELTDSLSQLAKKASRPYTPSGEPVTGTPTTTGAPTVTAGVWLDQIGVPDSTDGVHFYRYERAYEGSTVHINVVMNGQEGDTVRLRTADGSLSSYDSSAGGATGLMNASLLIDPRIDSTSKDEYMGPVIEFAVERDDSNSSKHSPTSGALPVQILITEEPAVDDIYDLAKPQKDNGDDTVTGTYVEPRDAAGFDSTPERGLGGTGVDSAQEIGSGIYQGDLAPGDLQIFKIPVRHGQFLSARLQFADNGKALRDLIVDGNVKGRIEVYDSVLTKRQLGFNKNGGVSQATANDNTLKAQTSQVRYRNREVTNDRMSFSEGYYYIAVSATEDENNKTYVIPFTLEVGVHGEESGAPQYADGELPLGPGVIDQTDSTSADSVDATSSEDDGGAPRWVWATVAGVGGAALIVGALLLARRRTASGPGAPGNGPGSRPTAGGLQH